MFEVLDLILSPGKLSNRFHKKQLDFYSLKNGSVVCDLDLFVHYCRCLGL